MVYTTLTSYNMSSGFQILFCYVNDITTSIFMNILLASVFIVIVVSSYMMQKRLSGTADFPVSFTLASVTSLIFAFLLRLVSCPYLPLISDMALAILISLLAVALGFLFFSRD